MKLRHVVVFATCALLGACASHAPKRGAATAPTRAPAKSEPGDDVSRSQSERYRQNSDNGPAAPPIDVSKIPEPVPKAEPRSRYGNKDSYEVLGKTYRVLPDGRGYVERGIASWYGNKFHGYMTSSFEKYDMYAFSAAHKTLPLPSYARVTNLDNGKSVVVRINDRGPFHENRIIDLSYAAAVKIGVWPKGTGLVEVRAIDPAHADEKLPPSAVAVAPPVAPSRPSATAAAVSPSLSVAPAPAAAKPAPASAAVLAERAIDAKPLPIGTARIYLQLGAYGERANAERALLGAQRAGLGDLAIVSVAVAGRTIHRLRLGPLADADAADAMTQRVQRLGLGTPRVAIER